MLYLNVGAKNETRKMSFGTVTGITVGERKWGGREIFLPTPQGVEDILTGGDLHHDLTIGMSRSGRPRINSTPENTDLYLILSSKWYNTLRGDGYILTPTTQENQLIARGYGKSGRIGKWDAVVLKARVGDVFRVTWSGCGTNGEPTYYIVTKDNFVHEVQQHSVEHFYEEMAERGEEVKMPFTLTLYGGDYYVKGSEWKRV